MAFEIGYADNGGVAIAWTAIGSGSREIVFVPGFISHLEVFWEASWAERFLRRLTSLGRVILLDKRGQGLSDRPASPPTLEEGMDDLRCVLDAAGARAPILFGVSEGGPMTMLFAATHPERTVGLILCGSYARLVRASDYPEGISEAGLQHFVDLIENDWAGDDLIRLFAPSSAADPAMRAWGRRVLRSGASPAAARNLLSMYRRVDVRDVLPAIRMPALVLCRRGDQIAPPGHSRAIAAGIPGARLVVLDGDDHVPVLGDTDALLDEVEEMVTGRRPGERPDRVLATVLFTDICDSTRRAVKLGDRRWRDLLAEHDRLVSMEVERHRGRVVKSTGDGALAIFDGPARAIESAVAIRDGVRAIGLEVRAGLHTGEVELIGDDVGGLAVHIGARVSAAAQAGEVRVSRTVTDLVAGSGLRFQPRERRELKGVPGKWELFAVLN